MRSCNRTLAWLAALRWIVQPAAAAYDPSSRNCDAICLTSMRWCSSGSGYDKGQTGCTFPQDTYPYYDRDFGINPAMLLRGKEYTISWKMADERYPVLIKWKIGNSNVPISWETTINDTSSAGSYAFNPGNILSSFPNQFAPNITADEARNVATTASNIIIISQPDKIPNNTNSISGEPRWLDLSDQFSVHNQIVTKYLDASADRAVREAEDRWKMGVGIGVGIGVPILLGLTALAVWILAKRRLNAPVAKAV